MDPAIREAVTICLRIILEDEPWQDFGFPKRPQYGSWFQNFRPEWRVELEKTLLQQMLCMMTGAYIGSGKVRQEFIRDLADTYTSDDKVVTALGFSSRAEGARVLKELIEQYASASRDLWPQMLHGHIRPDLLPDETLGAKIFSGAHNSELPQRT